jgi:mannose-6-phosphate isomerase-like protein (cupin superfamily)
MRQVITGISADGDAVFVADGPAEVLAADLVPPGIQRLWGYDSLPAVPTDGERPLFSQYFPASGGMRAMVINFRPDSHPGLSDAEMETLEGILLGLHSDATWDDDGSGMHSTQTIDLGFILKGSVVLELDGGKSTVLSEGDMYIQNGTRHTWRNPFEESCQVLIIMVGAEPR